MKTIDASSIIKGSISLLTLCSAATVFAKSVPTASRAAPAQAISHCVSSFDSQNEKDRQVLSRIEERAGGNLAAKHWASKNGRRFSLSPSGEIVLTVQSLSEEDIVKIAQSSNADANMFRNMVGSGAIQFKGLLCVNKQGVFSMDLRGIGLAGGKTGRLTLNMIKPTSLVVSGRLGGGDISGTFSAR